MTVNDFVKTIGYTRDVLSHFSFYLWDTESEQGIIFENPTIDQYVQFCDREVIDWMPELIPDKDEAIVVSITVPMIMQDRVRFADRVH